MTSQILRNARIYEQEKERFISAEARPALHLSARVGWMNDPNGFSYYDGKYHMFYQYHPYDSHWGPMHWGHAVSTDLIHWKYLPVVMAPDRPYDRDGVFSGNAITLPDGRHMLMYTGVMNEYTENGDIQGVQTQNLAFGDGFFYEKYEKNPVITEALLPEGGSRYDFRDPKIWQEEDGSYRMMAANNQLGDGGQMLLFRSEDAIHWSYVKKIAENHYRLGLMWECPDFFPLDGKQVLLASAQDMLPKGLEYHNGNGTFYMIGTWDKQTETFLPESDHAVDYGIDFYAPQTILTPDGRRVMIGWMQNWDTCNLHTANVPWFGQMSIPRELSVKNGVLYQKPIRELEELRGEKVEHRQITFSNDEISLQGISGRLVDMEVTVRPADSDNLFQKFAIHFAKNEQYHCGVSYRPHESTLKIDRKFSGSRRAIIHQRRARVNYSNGELKLRLLLDRYSFEIFVNDGEKVMSATMETDLNAQEITFYADGAVSIDVTKYELLP
jgi:beta-fructofuranosidase